MNGSVNGPNPPYISSRGDVWAMYGCVRGRRSTNPNMVRVRRQVPVEGSNAKLTSLTHPRHFTMGALSLICVHRNGRNMYGKSIHCMVHANGVTAQAYARHEQWRTRRGGPADMGSHKHNTTIPRRPQVVLYTVQVRRMVSEESFARQCERKRAWLFGPRARVRTAGCVTSA